jgi:hypothetical protein
MRNLERLMAMACNDSKVLNPIIASAIEAIHGATGRMDCFVASAPRKDVSNSL